MTTENHNRLHIFYNAQHSPYLYGAVHIVNGNLASQRWEKPFVISKRRGDGEEVVYGTVRRTLDKISSQFTRLKRFQSEAEAKLHAEGVTPLTQGILPESEVTDRILDEQEELIEDVLLTVSVNIRILSDIFPNQLKRGKAKIYDYDNACIATIELSKIADLLLHNRYILVRDQYVVDLFSDEKFLSEQPEIGLKIDFLEYMSVVKQVVNSITVKDLITKLWGSTTKLSASSGIRDIIFLTQNLYTLGGFVVGTGVPISGPWETIMNRVAEKEYAERTYPQHSGAGDTQIVRVVFTTPRFFLEPDLDHKQIRVELQVSGNHETLVMAYEDFFREVLRASGDRVLYVSS